MIGKVVDVIADVPEPALLAVDVAECGFGGNNTFEPLAELAIPAPSWETCVRANKAISHVAFETGGKEG